MCSEVLEEAQERILLNGFIALANLKIVSQREKDLESFRGYFIINFYILNSEKQVDKFLTCYV